MHRKSLLRIRARPVPKAGRRGFGSLLFSVRIMAHVGRKKGGSGKLAVVSQSGGFQPVEKILRFQRPRVYVLRVLHYKRRKRQPSRTDAAVKSPWLSGKTFLARLAFGYVEIEFHSLPLVDRSHFNISVRCVRTTAASRQYRKNLRGICEGFLRLVFTHRPSCVSSWCLALRSNYEGKTALA